MKITIEPETDEEYKQLPTGSAPFVFASVVEFGLVGTLKTELGESPFSHSHTRDKYHLRAQLSELRDRVRDE